MNGPRRVAAVLSDVGEVLFDEAEVVRKEAAAIRSSSRNWLERRREAMDRAEKAYLRILKLRPSPPPKWVVRAGASVAAMWAELDEELERTPQLRTLRFERLTLSAHERCALYAEKYQVWPEGAQRCHAWLSARYPRRHPALIELMPTLGGPVARIRTQPLR